MFKKLIPITSLILFTSCNAVYQVQKGGPPSGIPFHTKKLIYVHKTVYTIPTYDITLNFKYIQDQKSEVDGGTYSLRDIKPGSIELSSLINKIQDYNTKHDQNTHSISQIIQDFSKLPKIIESSGSATLLSNTLTREMVLSDTVYYLNGKEPWFGSKTINITLNSENTLAKTEGTSQSDITELLTSIIPASEIITSVLKLNDTSENDEKMITKSFFASNSTKPLEVRILLSLKGNAYNYEFKKEYESKPDQLISLPFNYNKQNASIIVTKSVANSGTSKEIKKENAVSFKGSINLPDN